MSRLDLFEDPLEGMTDDHQAALQTWGGMPDEENLNPRLPEEYRIRIPEEKRKILKNIDTKTLKSQKGQFASCWFYGEKESLAMWNLYSSSTGIV